MAIGAVSEVSKTVGADVHNLLVEFTMVGDDDYPAGGSTGVEAALIAETEMPGLEILAILDQGLNGGYAARWNRADDGLMLLQGNGVGVLIESSTTNLSGITFSFLALCR